MDQASWQIEQRDWAVLCRFCGDLHCKTQTDYFDIIGFKQYLFDETEMSHGTIREYVVRLRRLGNHLGEQRIPLNLLEGGRLDERLEPSPPPSTNTYRIALRKYVRFQAHRALLNPAQNAA